MLVDNVDGDSVHLHKLLQEWRTAIPFLRKYTVPAAKRVDADLLEFAVPKIAEVVSGRKNFKTAAKKVGGDTLRKQLGSGSRKREAAIGGKELAYGKQASIVIPTKSAKQIGQSRRGIFTTIFL